MTVFMKISVTLYFFQHCKFFIDRGLTIQRFDRFEV
jgi:hypothetical protein